MASLAKMEKRAVVAETLLVTKVQNQSRTPPSSPRSSPRILTLLSRRFGWLDKNKSKLEVSTEGQISSDGRQRTPRDPGYI
ncbi:TBC1 domain family member 2A-like [Canna indica]|uniref:TBC1 domain family member 2A-like n=1 Tax=Canna indica TaxID=4628 RepID=A0AAQ3KFE6_9LILI|nr:TBC1 domain family member 2A-like [Canna indica]